MKEFAFDTTLYCSIRVQANSRLEAVSTVRALIDGATANLGTWPNGDPIVCEVSMEDSDPELYEIDGVAP